ncbi:Hibernation-associated plasma protein HP-20 [Fukomys damarensis]|uniref:Hibernation-associated plasma protein HP-20 n=1 Tax=Fukomys damarensis TaxID=885580 RepID=A0A091D6E6_FUKDA|nr:Hibernation-associated plasma protein HP-20 [Fukomys damarensis]
MLVGAHSATTLCPRSSPPATHWDSRGSPHRPKTVSGSCADSPRWPKSTHVALAALSSRRARERLAGPDADSVTTGTTSLPGTTARCRCKERSAFAPELSGKLPPPSGPVIFTEALCNGQRGFEEAGRIFACVEAGVPSQGRAALDLLDGPSLSAASPRRSHSPAMAPYAPTVTLHSGRAGGPPPTPGRLAIREFLSAFGVPASGGPPRTYDGHADGGQQ